MAVELTHRMVSTRTQEVIEYRVSASDGDVSIPPKIGTISTSAIAEGMVDVGQLFAKEKAAAEVRLARLITTLRELESM